MTGEPQTSLLPTEISDRDLVLKFESLGDNCELGLVQRRAGAEPLGLLRFAGAPLPKLLRAMAARFAGLADPTQVRIGLGRGEYMVQLLKYDFVYHADAKVGDADPATLQRQQVRILPFLVEKLLSDLETAAKILVFRQNEPLLAADLIDLQQAVSKFGPGTLLWVQDARPGHPPGSADRIGERLLAGYVSRLATRENVPDLDLPSWLGMLRRAYALFQPPPPVPAITLRFGTAGNARASTGFGWSAPENGFTWSIGERSLLTLEAPQPADSYRLEMDVAPFVSPPALQSQRLTVQVNGETVEVFDPLTRGRVTCSVPGRLVRDHPKVEILLEHPRAASPRDVAGEDDTRPLAVAFRSLTLSGAVGA